MAKAIKCDCGRIFESAKGLAWHERKGWCVAHKQARKGRKASKAQASQLASNKAAKPASPVAVGGTGRRATLASLRAYVDARLSVHERVMQALAGRVDGAEIRLDRQNERLNMVHEATNLLACAMRDVGADEQVPAGALHDASTTPLPDIDLDASEKWARDAGLLLV